MRLTKKLTFALGFLAVLATIIDESIGMSGYTHGVSDSKTPYPKNSAIKASKFLFSNALKISFSCGRSEAVCAELLPAYSLSIAPL